MYGLNILLFSTQVTITLNYDHFKDFDEARKAVAGFMKPVSEQEESLGLKPTAFLEIEDHHGTGIVLLPGTVAGIVHVEYEKANIGGARIQVSRDLAIQREVTRARNAPAQQIHMPAGSPIIQGKN